jgi:hypothetical protein
MEIEIVAEIKSSSSDNCNNVFMMLIASVVTLVDMYGL